MNIRIYKYYWQAKIVAWFKREMVFSVLIDEDEKVLGYITGKLNTAAWQCWYGKNVK